MARGLDGRIRRLENGRVEPCVECGIDGGLLDYEVVWDDMGALGDSVGPDTSEVKRCGTCSRQLEFIVTWGNI